ncbi:nucleotide-binding domain-containing protein [Rhizopus microsporus ATCC 52813]|uniref:Nucleotide-binding domain-containing protein n=1 Tax=Rhizopus microsporus ATCC 52813 TaxID=1340429 RepID=A0A2G4SP55_RHIZD|nr:nucleotide-binding domain-containing protein [Rhizopus microsporus ATCC 52813]PHZ10568.1 nucleotide-binding domain-containing protein [Rhizopus microsporus ATCC 52813]
MEQTKIVVIGAGVIGLTTALTLKKRGWKNVKIIAKYTPGDMAIEYTSPYAGAHWRTMAPNDNPLLQKLDAVSYREFLRIAEQESKSNTGIMVVPSYDYYQDINPEFTNPWFKDLVKNFKFLREKDELPENAKIGHTYTTVLVNSPIYLKWLENNFKGLGGVIEKRAINDLREVLHQDVDVVINCTGLGSKYIAGIQDKALYPTRGQTIVARAPHIKRTLTYIGSHGITYIIPRSDGTVVLGGTANKNDFNPFSDTDTNQDILERTKRLCPELSTAGDLEIVRYSVGLRPTREGGPRFENEIYRTESGRKVLVTHAYGHGGFGYQSSWGSAEHTVEMMERGLSKIHNAKL